MSMTWDKVTGAVVVLVGVAVKVGESVFPFRIPKGQNFVAMNVANETGERFDLEISSVEGFETPTIYKPSLNEYVEFDAPRVGDWIRVLNPKVSREVDDHGKKKIRIVSGLQISRVIREIAGKASAKPAAGRRRRSAV